MIIKRNCRVDRLSEWQSVGLLRLAVATSQRSLPSAPILFPQILAISGLGKIDLLKIEFEGFRKRTFHEGHRLAGSRLNHGYGVARPF